MSSDDRIQIMIQCIEIATKLVIGRPEAYTKDLSGKVKAIAEVLYKQAMDKQ